MEVTLLDKSSLRIKGKKATLVIDPKTTTPKTTADAILLMDKDFDSKRVEEYRLVVEDDGEYEVGSIKITGSSNVYNINVDAINIILAKASSLDKLSDTSNEAEIAVINVDSALNESIIASLEAKAVLLYGEKASEGLKALGKQDLTPTKKFSPAKEVSTEEETQIVWLA